MRNGWILVVFLLGGCGTKPQGQADAGAIADLASVDAPDLAGVTAPDLGSPATHWKQESNAGSFSKLWGSSPTDLYAVGTGGNVTGYIYHSPGAGVWSRIKVTGSLYAVWGSAANDVYVAGLNMILHSTDGGASWKAETLPVVGGSWLIDALWGSGSGDIYAAGISTNASGATVGSSILHSTGNGTWVSQFSDGNGSSFSLWGADAGHVYAIDRHTGAVARSSGNGTWTANGALGAAGSIWGLAANQLYVTGANGVSFDSTDAQTWTPKPIPVAATEFLEDVWGTASTDLFIVGNRGSIFHFTGGSWTNDGVAGTKLRAIWGSGTDVFAAGADGIFHRE